MADFDAFDPSKPNKSLYCQCNVNRSARLEFSSKHLFCLLDVGQRKGLKGRKFPVSCRVLSAIRHRAWRTSEVALSSSWLQIAFREEGLPIVGLFMPTYDRVPATDIRRLASYEDAPSLILTIVGMICPSPHSPL